MPMQSTGGEKFSVYVYYRTKKYSEGDPVSSSGESEGESEEEKE